MILLSPAERWERANEGSGDVAHVRRWTRGRRRPQVIATGQTNPWGIAVDGVAVYWANQGANQAGVANTGASVMALPKEASQPVTLAANEQMCGAMVFDGAGGIIWQNGPNGSTNGALRRLVLPNGTPTSLASGLNDGTLWRLSQANGALSLISGPVSAMPGGGPGINVGNRIVSLLGDANALYAFEYWADGAGTHGRVRSAPKK